jgi:hypothetical protein
VLGGRPKTGFRSGNAASSALLPPDRRPAPNRVLHDVRMARQSPLVANHGTENACLGPCFFYGAARKVAICMTHGPLGEFGAVAL